MSFIPVDYRYYTQQTIAKTRTVRKAALAPSDPSSADFRVATKATMRETSARRVHQTATRNLLAEKGISYLPKSPYHPQLIKQTQYPLNHSNIR